MTKAKETTVVSSIVSKIMVALNLGEEGRLGKFFNLLKKQELTEIKKEEADAKSTALQYDIEKERLEDELEDAQEALTAAFENVKPEYISTNSDMKKFASKYWYNVGQAEATVARIEKALEELAEDNAESVKESKEQITKRQARIAKIS